MGILIKRIFQKNKLVKMFFLSLFFIGIFFGIFFIHNRVGEINQVTFPGRDVELDVELARTGPERQQGLSNHSHLEPNKAMLFLFDYPGRYSFWMKDMDFAIDIFWINAHKEIVFIKENALPSDYPEISYTPESRDVLYVLETVSGFAKKHDIQLGQKVSWSGK